MRIFLPHCYAHTHITDIILWSCAHGLSGVCLLAHLTNPSNFMILLILKRLSGVQCKVVRHLHTHTTHSQVKSSS